MVELARERTIRALFQHISSISIPHPMRVRITRRPPISYDLSGDSLRVGRIYDLPSEFACALIIEGCAEFADETAHRHIETRHTHGGFPSNTAHERRQFFVKVKPPRPAK